MDRSSASSEILFHGLPSKNKRPSIRKHSVVVIITFNSISFYETAICREKFSKYFFASIFVNFQKILAAHQKTFRKVLESSQKYTRGEVKTGVLKDFVNFIGKHPCLSLFLTKLQA